MEEFYFGNDTFGWLSDLQRSDANRDRAAKRAPLSLANKVLDFC